MQEIDLVYEALVYDGWIFPSIVTEIIYKKYRIDIDVTKHLDSLVASGIVVTNNAFVGEDKDGYDIMYRKLTPTEIANKKCNTTQT